VLAAVADPGQVHGFGHMVLQITLHMREGAIPASHFLNLMVPWERLAGLLMISMDGI
jgi:hypothetical protein